MPSEAVPWSSLFRYRAIWGLMIGSFCHNFINFWFVTWFPTYLVEARPFSLLSAGMGGLVPPHPLSLSRYSYRIRPGLSC